MVGNAAPDYLYGEQDYNRAQNLEPVWKSFEGGHMDEDARRGPSRSFFSMVSYVVAVVMMVFVLGGISVTLTSGTVAIMQSNVMMSSKIDETLANNDDLRIECSVLSRSERVGKIATQNLGMVYASEADTLAIN